MRIDHQTIGQFIVGLAAIALIVGLAALIQSVNFVKTGARTEGRVIALEKDLGSPTSFHTVFTFVDVHGTEHRIKSNVASSPPEYTVGETVTVLYDGGSPEDAKISNFFELWGLPLIIAIPGLFWLFVGIGVLNWTSISARLGHRPNKTPPTYS